MQGVIINVQAMEHVDLMAFALVTITGVLALVTFPEIALIECAPLTSLGLMPLTTEDSNISMLNAQRRESAIETQVNVNVSRVIPEPVVLE
jgi:hypothetical protein